MRTGTFPKPPRMYSKGKPKKKTSRKIVLRKHARRGKYLMTNAHPERRQTPLTRPLKVGELFAGVGGFKLGLERVAVSGKPAFKVVWGNQWEPSTKQQHAFEIYKSLCKDEVPSNLDIGKVDFSPEVTVDKATEVAAPNVDVLVGGFPCQDYSVARTLSHAEGLVGKKGVLWWQIHRFLVQKGEAKPAFLIFENVDRLLKSPASQRGRDFAVLLASLGHLGYRVEWRVINAAEYGFPQRRRRVFMVGYHHSTHIDPSREPLSWLTKDGTLAKAFPVEHCELVLPEVDLKHQDLTQITRDFNKGNKMQAPFKNGGIFAEGRFWTSRLEPNYDGEKKNLGDVLIDEKLVPKEFIIPEKELPTWRYLKGAKNEPRTNKATGFEYFYTEGPIAFPDPIEKPSRTIITGEGGRSPSRFKHVVRVNGHCRRLTPLELERLNGFPDNHTAGVTDGRRAFFMGNALVVGVVERIGKALAEKIFDSK